MDSEIEKIISQINQEEDIFAKTKLINYLIQEKQLRIVEVARRLKIKPPYLCHLLRLERLPPTIIDGYYSKLISISHLFVISRIKDKNKMLEAYEKILAKNLTVTQTEELVREIIYKTKTKGKYLSSEEKLRWIEKLKLKWQNLKLKIIQTQIRSKIIFEIRGNLEKTTLTVKEILEKLTK